jgi:hypothetical protein
VKQRDIYDAVHNSLRNPQRFCRVELGRWGLVDARAADGSPVELPGKGRPKPVV